MAIFHFSASVISRSSGRSSVAAAAYRAGCCLVDERQGTMHDYTNKKGVDFSEIMAPSNASKWVFDRQSLFTQVEKEIRRDAQFVRDINTALPVELTPEQNRELVRGFVQSQFTAAGMVADVAFHHLTGPNPHAHMLLTLRSLDGEKFGKKQRDWNRPELLRHWRKAWAQSVNLALEKCGHNARISSLSLVDQRAEIASHETAKMDALARLPTEHHGGRSEVKKLNAEILANNSEIAEAFAAAATLRSGAALAARAPSAFIDRSNESITSTPRLMRGELI